MKKHLAKMILAGVAGLLLLTSCTSAIASDEPATEDNGSYLTQMDLGGDPNGYVEIDDWTGGLLLTQEDLDIMWDNMLVPDVQVIVDGESIDAPAPYVNREAGTVMVPVTYIAEALGYSVVVEDDEIIIGRGSIITVGVNNYHYNRMAPVELLAAPEIHDGTVFVPLDFFGQVFPAFGFIEYGNVVIRSMEDGEIE